MVQRLRMFRVVDAQLRRYIYGQSDFQDQIKLALERADPFTRQLVLFRAHGGDYRQAMQRFHISASTYHRRLRNFRQSLINLIQL